MPTKLLTLMTIAVLVWPVHADIRLKEIAAGFERPVWAGMPSHRDDKLWIMEQAGKIHILDLATGKRHATPFLDITSKVTRKGNEQGLLGMAFDPDFENSGRYYIYYTDHDDRICVARYVAPDQITTDQSRAELLLRDDQPYRNHNGGWIEFGPDGMLYIGTGDGGKANDPKNFGQDLNSRLGKILRIDVSPDRGYDIPEDNPFTDRNGVHPEIWAYGLRNPWRCSFDRKTGDLWIADVGQNHWEEINFMPRGKGAGANYGWRLREGLIETPKKKVGGPAPEDHVEPVYVYAHGQGPKEGLSVTGGYVYRGAIKSLRGRYIFADYQLPRIWSFRLEDGTATDFVDHSQSWQPDEGDFSLIASFAENNRGELYVISLTGDIYQLGEY